MTKKSETEPQGFYAKMPDGSYIHVLGDPAMSEETLDAIRRIAEAAILAMERGELGKPSHDSEDNETDV